MPDAYLFFCRKQGQILYMNIYINAYEMIYYAEISMGEKLPSKRNFLENLGA